MYVKAVHDKTEKRPKKTKKTLKVEGFNNIGKSVGITQV